MMVGVMIVFGIAVAIVFIAARIILGWVLPRQTMAAVDRGFSRAAALYVKLVIVALGIGIVALIVVSAGHN